MLHIFHPPTYLPERHYIFHVLLQEFLGLNYQTEIWAKPEICITHQGDYDNKCLILPDILFQTPESDWLTAKTLPEQPLKIWTPPTKFSDLSDVFQSLPIIYGKDQETPPIADQGPEIRLCLDIFGSAFFMLTRYEEIVKPERDHHQRFPATASLAFQEDFLERAIVNEYLEILWVVLQSLWPGLQRKSRNHHILLSHDVDWPLCTLGRSPIWVLKNALADLARRQDLSLATRRLWSYIYAQSGHFDQDPCNTFDFIMGLSEKYGLHSAFYFIAAHSAGEIDGIYQLDIPWLRCLLKKIHQRGHEIGLHPSYNTYRDTVQIKHEFEILRQVSEGQNIQQEAWGGRQHYLRWENPITWQNWDNAGLDYDTTIGFADQVGFRCGVCYEYPVFNLQTRQSLNLYERPLIVMEQTLLSYGHLPFEVFLEKIVTLNQICRQFNGDFTLLWHNDNLSSGKQKLWYRLMVQTLAT